MAMKIRKGDTVVVLTGKDKGRQGEVKRNMADNMILVEGINIVKKHMKPSQRNEGGIKDKEMPIHISNVAIYNPGSKKADRIGFKFLSDGRKVRYFKSNNEIIDV